MKPVLFFVFSNKTQFETAIPLFHYFKKRYSYIAVFDMTNPGYSIGLKEYLEEYKYYFENIFVLREKRFTFLKITQLLLLKRFILHSIRDTNIESSIQFTEGGSIDWLVIGTLKECGIQTTVLQWAITWEPSYYDRLHKNKAALNSLKQKITKKVKTCLNLEYPTMKYLGDGQSDYILTMGDFWTQQFIKYHQKHQKFISIGNPRFLELATLKEVKSKTDILFITGAGTSIYGYNKQKHLNDIREVYIAFSNAHIKNKLIHKIHPRDKYCEEIINLASKCKNIEVEQKLSTYELLKTTLATIVIRSTVGLEALISGSLLIVYNNMNQSIGFNFSKYGLAYEAKTEKEVTKLLSDLVNLDKVPNETIEFYIKMKDVMENLDNVISKD